MSRHSFLVRPGPDPRIPTELALASDGGIYVALTAAKGHILDRPVFIGYALNPIEVSMLGPDLLFAWASMELLALGTDGRIYVNASALGKRARRPVFRGYKANDAEAAVLIEELHRTALNLTISMRSRGRTEVRKSRRKRAARA